METQLISPKAHGISDYLLAGSLLILPTVFKFDPKVRSLYAAEAITLLTYIALTDHPAAVKPVIPFTTHGKIDPLILHSSACSRFGNHLEKIRKRYYSTWPSPLWLAQWCFSPTGMAGLKPKALSYDSLRKN